MTEQTNGILAPALTTAIVAAILLFGQPALAATVNFPKAEPKIAVDVPDGWSVENEDIGLIIRSPEKNSIMVGQVIARDKKAIEAWRDKAAEKLRAAGVSFNAKPATAKPGDGKSSDGKPGDGKPATPSAAAEPASQTPVDFAKDANAFTFSGAPSLATPETSTVAKPAQIGPNSLEALAPTKPGTPKPGSRLTFTSIEFTNTTIADKPVDAELIIYDVSPKRVFVVMQESNPDDNRSVAIAKSVRAAK